MTGSVESAWKVLEKINNGIVWEPEELGNVHGAASLLKQYFRELSLPLIPDNFEQVFTQEEQERIALIDFTLLVQFHDYT